MKHLLILITSILLLTACGKDDSKEIPRTSKRTVIVYMSAETNLSDYAQSDINEMIQGRRQVGDDCNLVIYVDRASRTEMPFIARITGKTDNPVDTLYKYPTDFYSSDPENFSEVLRHIVSLCPATQDYGLVFWGHADGWILENDNVTTSSAPRRAYGVDNGDNTNINRAKSPSRWLNIPNMAQALAQVGIKWKFIFCDCCNMQNAEVAYELRNITDYIIASPAEITGVGAPYDTMVKDFFIQNDEEMYIQMCSDYNAQIDYVGGHLPISVVRTSKMQALADATKAVLPEVATYLSSDNPTQGHIYYYSASKGADKEKVMYDMYGMIRAALADEPEKFSTWEQVFNQTVIYAEASTKWHANTVDFNDFTVTSDNFGGISMFFPLEKYAKASHDYNNDIKQMQWYQAVGWSEVGW